MRHGPKHQPFLFLARVRRRSHDEALDLLGAISIHAVHRPGKLQVRPGFEQRAASHRLAKTLVCLSLSAVVPTGSELYDDADRVGVLTSIAPVDDGKAIGLGFVKPDRAEPGIRLHVKTDLELEVVELAENCLVAVAYRLHENAIDQGPEVVEVLGLRLEFVELRRRRLLLLNEPMQLFRQQTVRFQFLQGLLELREIDVVREKVDRALDEVCAFSVLLCF